MESETDRSSVNSQVTQRSNRSERYSVLADRRRRRLFTHLRQKDSETASFAEQSNLIANGSRE